MRALYAGGVRKGASVRAGGSIRSRTSVAGSAAEEGTSRAAEPSLLEAQRISKRFGGLSALADVSLSVNAGEIVGLVGPNGAGKTTLFNCMLGVVRPDSGLVYLQGRRIDSMPVWKRSRLGIARTFQRLEVFTGMTPREHFIVAMRVSRRQGGLFKDLMGRGLPTAPEQAAAQEMLDLVGLVEVADVTVEALSLGHARLVELGRALMLDPLVLMLDEPSSGLDGREREMVGAILKRSGAERNVGVLLVEHDLQMVSDVASRLVVLDSGRVIAEGGVAEVLALPAVRKAYLGTP